MVQDIRSAWRFLWRRAPSTIAAVTTLGIGLWVCTLAAGLLDQALTSGLNLPRPAELVTLYNTRPTAPNYQVLSYPDYTTLRDALDDALDLAAFVRVESTATIGGEPLRIRGELVSGNYFAVLRTLPMAGRALAAADERDHGSMPMVISESLWRRRFGADPAALGRTIPFGTLTATIVGVAPSGFHGPVYPSDFWMPIAATPAMLAPGLLTRQDVPLFQTVGRLRGGTAYTVLRARVRAMATFASKQGWRLDAYPGAYLKYWPAYRAAVARFLGVFAAIAACVLLVACANLAGLIGIRGRERQRELAVRQAVGATPFHIARRVIAEVLVLVGMSAGVGVVLVRWTAPLLSRLPFPVPVRLSVTADLRLLAIGVAITALVTAIFLALSFGSTRGVRLEPVLRATGSSVTAGLARHRALVAAELALTFVVLTLAGLLAKSAWKVERTPAGFDPANLVAADLDLRSRPAAEGLRFFERLREELLRTDGVTAAALGQQLPLGAIRATDTFSVASVDLSLASRYDVVSPGYFATLGIAILDGRDFRDSDRADSAPVAILNEELARRIGGGAIGRTIRSGRDGIAARVIGVVHDSKYNDITEPPQPFVYFPMAQKFRQEMHVFVRTRQQDALPTLRGAVRRLDPGVAVAEFQTMTEQAARARAVPRVSALASSSAAAAALFLAVVGLYGMVMTAVQLRAREIAIRAALGSRPSQTITRLVREVAISTVAGLSVGGVVAVPAGRLLAAMLFEVSPADPIVLTVVAAALSLAAACACIVPARRALALDPAALLRN